MSFWAALALTSVAAASHSCVDEPAAPACASYVYPNASSDLATVCGSMAAMPGCSVLSQCQSGGARGAAVCADFSLLHRVCDQMPGMAACATIGRLCANGTVVSACASEPEALAQMPTASQARSAALGVCASMPKMQACTSCTSGPAPHCPDPLLSLSRLCTSMPGMASCAGWEAWCRLPGASESLPAYCAGVPAPGGGGVPMRMYFHTGWRDYILFESWVPHSLTSYLLACVGVVCAAVLSVALRGVRAIFEVQNALSGRRAAPPESRTAILRANAVRALLVTVSTALDYALMLVAMTFNAGLFLCVCGGLGFGTLLFGHWGRTAPPKAAQDCCANDADGRAAPFLAQPHFCEAQSSSGCH